MRRITVLIACMFLCAIAYAQENLFSFEFEEIADNVWVGVRADSPRFPVMGNTTFVISDEGVVVFDGGGVSAMADQIIDKVRSLTTVPVTHVVISHWHGDHNFGVHRFAEEFPDVQFIAHRFTRDVMNSPRIAYIDSSKTLIERNREMFETAVATGKRPDGSAVTKSDQKVYALILQDADLIHAEYQRIRVTPPNVIMDDELIIKSGDRVIELRHLGHANTAGDIVMWLPEERIVATGDIVVLPTPYAFNVSPRAWAETLRNLKRLDYKIMVPGHGPIQRDTSYVDLVIEAADSIADQRDALLAEGMSTDDIGAALDFSAFDDRFMGGDSYLQDYYDSWFEKPFRAAAIKALTGEPMVAIERPEIIPFDDERWKIEAAESEYLSHLGQSALKLQGGSAILADTDIRNGIVEFDIAVSEERGFAGLMFRVQDAKNFEHFYIRPHQSGNPDANQYTPVFDGVSAWQLYHGPGYGAPVGYRFDEWMHVKVVYAGSRADVYIDSDEPVLRVNNLKRDETPGSIGIHAASFAPAYFANVKVSALAGAYELPSTGPSTEEIPAERVMSWQVSESFADETLDAVIDLEQKIRNSQEWTQANAEPSGILNLASVPMQFPGRNTRFAKLVIESDQRQSKLLSFGYSDAAKVFVNGVLQYSGDNTYMSRDYRYLGTIGFFDTVVLPLEAGENEILIAVTEAFGGWGVMAEFTDLEGIEIQ